MRFVAVCVALCTFTACSSEWQGPEAEPAPSKKSTTTVPSYDVELDDSVMRPEEAHRIVARIQANWPPAEDDPLRNPQSLDDVEKILKLDQVNLFQGAVDFASRQEELRAQVLEGQIEIAWGEAYSVLTEVMLKVARQFETSLMAADQGMALSHWDQEELRRLQRLTDQTSRLVEAFTIISGEHVSRGASIARRIIQENPDNYLGYRLAADAYRTVRQWDNFGVMMQRIEETNPNSNGLVFLKAAAAAQRDGDPTTATEFYQQALGTDPEFVRAQAHLVMIQETVPGLAKSLQALKKSNPIHPVILWAEETVALALRLYNNRA